jgi:superfamily II DNA or RNA helicase
MKRASLKGNTMNLRDYQVECLEALVTYRRSGGNRALVTLPTASGKTVVFAQIPRAARKRVLVVAHRTELLDQAKNKMQAASPDMEVGLEQAASHASDTSNILLASVQTLAVSPHRLQALDPTEFSSIIIDEAHHTPAKSYQRILHHFGLCPDPDLVERRYAEGDIQDSYDARHIHKDSYEDWRVPEWAPYLIGFTATPGRTDKRGLGYYYDEIVYARTIREMMDAGWLCKVRGIHVTTDTDISDVKVRAGEYVERDLSEAVNTPERNALITLAYHDHAEGRQTLVFCVDREHAGAVCEAFREDGITAELLLGNTPPVERRRIVAGYSAGSIPVMVGVMVFTEGFDAPATSCIIMARPTRSSLVYTQAIGRGTRIAPGKEDLLVLDLVDVSKKTSVQTVNSLFGLPPKLKLEGEDVVKAQETLEQYEGQVPFEAMGDVSCFDDLDRLAREFDPLRQTALPSWLESATRNAWVPTSWGYALSVMGKGQMGVIENLLGQATVRWKEQGRRPIQLGEPRYNDARDAVIWADQWISREAGGVGRLLDRDAAWRDGAPSEKQIEYLKRLKIIYPANITKGQASSLIDRERARRTGGMRH